MNQSCANCVFCGEAENGKDFVCEVALPWWAYEYTPSVDSGRYMGDPNKYGHNCDSWTK